MTESTPKPEVTSVTTAPALRWVRSQWNALVCAVADVTTRNASSPVRVTVPSSSVPPRALSMAV